MKLRPSFLLVILGVALSLMGLLMFFSKTSIHRDALLAEMDIPDLTQKADAIVMGTVEKKLSSYKGLRGQDETVFTPWIIKIEQTLKGNLPSKTIRVKTEGGRYGLLEVQSEDEPEFKIGEKVLVFLSESVNGEYVVTGFTMGKYSIENHAANGERAIQSPRNIDRSLMDLKKEISASVK